MVPIASLEQHGPHLPLLTDTIQAEEIARRAAERAQVLYTPTVWMGYSPQHMYDPGAGTGTITIRPHLLLELWYDIGRSLIHHGFDKLVFVNNHGSICSGVHWGPTPATARRHATHPDRFDTETGEAHYCKALALAEPRGMRPLVAHCHLGLGKLYRRTGKREQAQEHLTTATTMYREMDMRFWLEQAEAEMGKWE